MNAVKRQIKLRNEQDQHLRDNIMLARKEVCLVLFPIDLLNFMVFVHPWLALYRHNVQWLLRQFSLRLLHTD